MAVAWRQTKKTGPKLTFEPAAEGVRPAESDGIITKRQPNRCSNCYPIQVVRNIIVWPATQCGDIARTLFFHVQAPATPRPMTAIVILPSFDKVHRLVARVIHESVCSKKRGRSPMMSNSVETHEDFHRSTAAAEVLEAERPRRTRARLSLVKTSRRMDDADVQ